MKKLMLLCLMTVTGLSYAQEINPTECEPKKKISLPDFKNEIGLFVQEGGKSPENITLGGLRFRRLINEHLAYRIIAGYGLYEQVYQPAQITINHDTVFKRFGRTYVNLGVVGLGVETRRRLINNISLIAGLEMRAGYGGGGTTDTLLNRAFQDGNMYMEHESIYGIANKTSIFYSAFTPTIGVRTTYKRLAGEIELYPLTLSHTTLTYDRGATRSTFNFASDAFYTRFTLSYSFGRHKKDS